MMERREDGQGQFFYSFDLDNFMTGGGSVSSTNHLIIADLQGLCPSSGQAVRP
jgi:hypothetical protein